MKQLIEQLVDRSLDEGIITDDEVTLLSSMDIDESKVGVAMMHRYSEEIFGILEKIFSNISEVVIRKNKALVGNPHLSIPIFT